MGLGFKSLFRLRLQGLGFRWIEGRAKRNPNCCLRLKVMREPKRLEE